MHEINKHCIYTLSKQPETMFSAPKKVDPADSPDKHLTGGP